VRGALAMEGGVTAFVHSRTGQYTSALAGVEVHGSGVAADQRARVFAAVMAHPGWTSAELAGAATGLDRYQVARRLPELEHEGRVVKGPHRRRAGRA
jgi:hypothetical protein